MARFRPAYSGVMPTLVVVRHAKSDWEVRTDDRHRPLAARGRRQAPMCGRWIRDNVGAIDLAVVSVAARASQTWQLLAAELDSAVPVQASEPAYTFDGDDLVDLVRGLPEGAATVALVSHNPAVEELVEALTGDPVPMPTSAIAVIDLPAWTAAGDGQATLRYAGRPADG